MEILNEILKWGDKNVSSPVCDFFGARLDSSVWIECGFVGRVGLGRNLDCVIEKKFFKSQATNLRESRGDHDKKKRKHDKFHGVTLNVGNGKSVIWKDEKRVAVECRMAK